MEGPCSPLPNTAPHRHRLPPHYFSLCCMEGGEPKGRGELIQLHSSKRGSRWQPKPTEADSSCMPQEVLSFPPAPAMTTAVWQRSMTLKQNVFFFFFFFSCSCHLLSILDVCVSPSVYLALSLLAPRLPGISNLSW